MEQKMITIPFDLERAKRISEGFEEGKIITEDGNPIKVIYWDYLGSNYPIIALTCVNNVEWLALFTKHGTPEYSGSTSKLVLQVPVCIQYKDGDILACEVNCGIDNDFKWFSILKGNIEMNFGKLTFSSYASCNCISCEDGVGWVVYGTRSKNVDSIRLATDEEKQMFIKRLKEENTSQAKDILKRFFGIEEKKGFEFLQPVLVRINPYYQWLYGNFTHMSGGLHYVSGGVGFEYCIPYNENTKHLLGTTDNWEEK